MEVQLISPSPPIDFNYDSTSTSPYATAPSSPHSSIPFTWEQTPGIPKHNNHEEEEDLFENESDFAFGHIERHSISAADELFDGGKIKPLKPPPRLHFSNDSPKSPKSPKLRLREALSPRSRKKDFDPFSEAFKQTVGEQTETYKNPPQRGREETTKTTRRGVSRSLSPFRVSDILNNQKNSTDQIQSSPTSLTWYNKLKLKNLLLFRSASEGSETTRKDPLKKYTMLKKSDRDGKTTTFSFRSTDSGGSVEVSAAATEEEEVEVRRKTSFPYKSGLMGCLRFHQNPGSVHEISRGINSVIKQ